MQLAITLVALLIIIYIVVTRFLLGNGDSVKDPAATLTISDAGITTAKPEGFTTLFPDLKDKYPVYTMMQPTKNNIDAVNALDSKAWDLITGITDKCDSAYAAACKTYSIKNKGQFRTHLDTYRKWLNSLDTAALTKLSSYLTSAGIEYDFDNRLLLLNRDNTKYVIMPITNKDTPIVDSVVIPQATTTNSISVVVYPAPLNTMYTLYTTYTMLVMTMYKITKRDVEVVFDVMWTPISSEDYTKLSAKAKAKLSLAV